MNVELFACAGGMARGFQLAGIEFDLAVDVDENAVASYEANIGRRPVRVDVRDLLRLMRLGLVASSSIDLLVADPPCIPWSRSGKRRGLDDDRDMIVETCEAIAALRPRAWLIGNVPGLDDGPNWPVVQRTIGAIPGYCVDYRSFDAADFGVPQRRVRPFWFGHPRGTPCIRWPRPTHGNPRELGDPRLGEDRRPWVTCRNALAHVPPEDLGRAVNVRRGPRTDRADRDHAGRAVHDDDEPAATITTTRSGSVLVRPNHPASELDRPSHTIKANGGRASGGAALLEVDAWPWDRPATTVLGDDRLALPGHHPESGSWLTARDLDRPANRKAIYGKNVSHSTGAIVISERVATILQGFPEGWQWIGKTKTERWSMIGQAMPIAVARAVATAIVDWRSRSGI